MTWMGFSEEAPESRYTTGLPWKLRFSDGKSARILSTVWTVEATMRFPPPKSLSAYNLRRPGSRKLDEHAAALRLQRVAWERPFGGRVVHFARLAVELRQVQRAHDAAVEEEPESEVGVLRSEERRVGKE